MTPQQLAFWCRFGHEMTPDNTYRGRRGARLCKTCLRIHLAAIRRWKADERKSLPHNCFGIMVVPAGKRPPGERRTDG